MPTSTTNGALDVLLTTNSGPVHLYRNKADQPELAREVGGTNQIVTVSAASSE